MATQVAITNGFSQQSNVPDVAVIKLAQQLGKLRNDVLAGIHPRLQAPKHLLNGVSPSASDQSVGQTSASSLPNGLNAQATAPNAFPGLTITKPQPLQTPKPFAPATAPASVDARAVLEYRRKGLEKILQEQIQRKTALSRLRPCDQEIIADFDVTEVLRKAQERVKPFKLQDDKVTNRAVSSSDSFDDQTFYSSQMDSSTTTEEVENSKEFRRPLRACRFFRDGKPCPYGEKCTFSHDPSVAKKPEVDDSKQRAGHGQSRRTNDQASRKAVNSPLLPPKAPNARAPAQNNISQDPQQTRIAELEEQLRLIKEQQQRAKVTVVPRAVERDEVDNTPPTVDEFGRDRSRRVVDTLHAKDPVRIPSPANLSGYQAEIDNYISPTQKQVHVVRNHITTPHAPQPARISPLAAVKPPQVTQLQPIQTQPRPLSRNNAADIANVGPSPNAVIQHPSSKKRRRGLDLQEQSRNVVQRRDDVQSPVVRIKEEPVSPPPYQGIPNHVQTQRTPAFVENVESYPEERVIYRPQYTERPVQDYEIQERRPMTPTTRRVISRNGQRYTMNEEPDLRRVVSANILRAPLSPDPYNPQHSDPRPRVIRAASQAQHISPIERAPPIQYRNSLQPQAQDAPRSPLPRRIPVSPPRRTSMAMPPPARRIVIDDLGDRYVEEPVPIERSMSVATARRQFEMEPQYEPAPPRSAVVRQPRQILVDESGRYLQEVEAPPSSQYIDYQSVPRKRRIIQLDQEVYDDGTYDDGSRLVQYEPQRPIVRYAETNGMREGMVRTQSVRPVDDRSDMMSREAVTRVSSVRPQQHPRIVSLGEQHEMTPRVIRQVSVRPDDGLVRPMQRVQQVQQEPLYQQYASQEEEGRYEEVPSNEGVYEQPASAVRRYVQRL